MEPESLQNVFDSAFAGISQVRGSITLDLFGGLDILCVPAVLAGPLKVKMLLAE